MGTSFVLGVRVGFYKTGSISFALCLVFSSNVWAENACSRAAGSATLVSTQAGETQERVQSFLRLLKLEFGKDLVNEQSLELIRRGIVNQSAIESKDVETFRSLMQYLGQDDIDLSRRVMRSLVALSDASPALQTLRTESKSRESSEIGVALKLARSVGRQELGKNGRTLGEIGNLTEEQISWKDRILELGGFSLEERVSLLSSQFLAEDITESSIEHFELNAAFPKNPQQAREWNEDFLQKMRKIPYDQGHRDSRRKDGINETEAQELYEAVTRHPVARLLNSVFGRFKLLARLGFKDYDPLGNIGFCFGRAFTGHLEALSRGISKEAIKKVFVAGSIKAVMGEVIWGYHVALAVRSTDGDWWVVDPFFGRVAKLEEWYERFYSRDLHGTLRIFATSAERAGGHNKKKYDRDFLYLPENNGYFEDVIKYYRYKVVSSLPEPRTPGEAQDLKEGKRKYEKGFLMRTLDWILKILKLGV